MVSFRSIAALVASVSVATALNTIVTQQQQFVDTKTGERLVLLGVDYQPGGQGDYKPQDGVDALTDSNACLRDAIMLQSLGVNTIRIYNIDPALNHDACMSIFDYAGIYVILDVNSPLPGESIDRSAPWTTYDESYLTRVFGVIEAFKDYDNTLAFFSGNEIINDLNTTMYNPQYIRAVQRDMKNYIAKHASRTIPVGYSAADVREVLRDTWAYLQCAIDGNANDPSRSDFFGLNSYSWCGAATFQSSTYSQLIEFFGSSTIPTFFSEFGCNKVEPRTFTEVAAIYGPQMTVMSGGLVYEYSQETDDYGLLQINSDASLTLLVDFNNLQTQYDKVNLTLIETTNSTATSLKPPTCSAGLIESSYFDTNFTLPDTPAGDLIANGISNPNNGKLVSVTATAMPVAVTGTNGKTITGLSLQQRSSQNAPGGASTNTSTAKPPTNSSSSGSGKKSAASSVSVSAMSTLSTVFIAGVLGLLFL